MATIFDILLNQHLNNNLNKSSLSPQQVKPIRIDFVPELDVVETNESFVIETELPGVNKEDIQIEIKDSKLYIQGEKKRSTYKANTSTTTSTPQLTQSTTADQQPSIEEFEDNIKSYDTSTAITTNNDKKESTLNQSQPSPIKKYISERSYGNFQRYLDLTRVLYTLDLSTIKTQFNNGLLTITINKKQDHSNTIKISL